MRELAKYALAAFALAGILYYSHRSEADALIARLGLSQGAAQSAPSAEQPRTGGATSGKGSGSATDGSGTTATQNRGQQPSGAGTFHGFTCTEDCSGHEAGYEWAEQHDIDDPHTCYTGPRLSNPDNRSFSEGCEAYVDNSTGAARLDDPYSGSEDDNTNP